MRVAVISEFYHPNIGGAERVSRAIAEAAAGSGLETHVITSGNEAGCELINGVEVHRFNITGNLVKGIKGEINAVVKCLDTIAPDIVIVYALQTWGSDLILQGRYTAPADTKLVVIPCGLSALSSIARKIIYNRYLNLLHKHWKQFDHYIFHTKTGYDYQFLGELTVERQTIIKNFFPGDVLGWSPELADQHFQELDLDFLSERPFVLNISNHYKIKGHATLIRNFTQCFPHDWQLVIAGSTPDGVRNCENSCLKQAARSDRISILDGTDRKLVLSLLHRASLFFLTSRIEYCPLVLLEAQAAGLPFLSFPVGNAHELSGGITIDSRRLSPQYIENLLQQRPKLDELGRRGRAQSRAEHSEPVIQEQYMRLLYHVTGTD